MAINENTVRKLSIDIKKAYDSNENSIIEQQECQSNQGYWGNEIEFLNTTFDQQNKNRRVKIIFSKN